MIKRYFILTTEYPPFYGGGIATYCKHTVKMLTERGIEVTVILPDESLENNLSIEENKNLRVVRFKPGGGFFNYLGWLLGLSYQFSELVKELVEKEGLPDLVEAQDYLGIAYYILQRKYALEDPFRNLRVLITLHTPKFICDLYNEAPVYKFPDFTVGEAERWCIKSADGVVSPSEYLKRELLKFQELKGINLEVVRNPYEVEDFEETSGEKRDLVFVGRLEKRKGILELIELMKGVWQEGWEIPLYLIGGDTWFHPKGRWMSQWLKEKYGYYFREGFLVYAGKLSPLELKKRLRERAKIGIVPSLFENFPYVVIELIENGVIPLVSNRGGMAELVGEKGFIFKHEEENSFRDKLIKLITLDETELEKLRKYHLERVKSLCSYEVVFNKKFEYLERVLNSKRKSFYPFLREIEIKSTENRESSENGDEVKDLLSVVIPYYNLGELILETLRSIEESTYPYKEIIIVNDASTDQRSLEILKELEGSRENLRIIHKERNEGLALARNTGAFEARGEFIAFVDADDLVEKEYFERAIRILKNYENVSFVGCWLEYFEGSQGLWITFNPEFPYILFHNSINSQGIVIRKRDFLKFGLNDPRMKYGMEDYDMILNLLKHGKRGVVIPEVLFKYRVRKASMLRQFTPYTYLYLYNLLTEKHRELYQAFGAELFNLQNANGPAFMIDNPGWESFLWYKVLGGESCQEVVSLDESVIPQEFKETLKKLWSKKWFRSLVKINYKILKRFLK